MFCRLSKRALAVTVCAALVMVAGTALATSIHGQYKGFNIVKLFVDGREIKPDVPAIIMDDRTLLPARYLAEALGASVNFDPATYTVNVQSKQSTASTREGFYVTDKDVGIMVAAPTLKREAHGAVCGVGNKFLQVMVIVKNFGQQDIFISPETFSIMVGQAKYDFVSPTTSDSFRLSPRVVHTGDYAAGIVIYEVPENATYELVPSQLLYSSKLVRVPVQPVSN